MFNNETRLKSSSDPPKNEREESETQQKAKHLACVCQAQSSKSSQVTSEARGTQHGSNELAANCNYGDDSSLVLQSAQKLHLPQQN